MKFVHVRLHARHEVELLDDWKFGYVHAMQGVSLRLSISAVPGWHTNFEQGPEEFLSTNDPGGQSVQPELVILSILLLPRGHAWLAHEPNNPGTDRSVPGGQVLMHSVEELLS